MGMTLEQYIAHEYAEGKIDFTFRAHVYEGKTTIYIHPMNVAGLTTPSLVVKDNAVEWPSGWPQDFELSK